MALALLSLAGCTDFRFADDLRCSVLGKCPPGYFCDTSSDVCLRDLATCGNGAADPEEVCDDGNRKSGDGCRADCLRAEICGDGLKDPQETCDDGNGIDTDSCPGSCQVSTCGDGFVHVGSELCDDGNAVDSDGCNTDCSTSQVVQVVAGHDHTCVLRDSGRVRCWGSAFFGQLGYGNPNDIGDDEIPAKAGDVPTGGTVVQIAAGGFHTCALLSTGKVRCWGRGYEGQLGYGNRSNIGDDETPARVGDVPIGGTAVQITAGESHTCARLDTGKVRCWGYGFYGQLGYGKTNNIGDDETPAKVGDVPVGDTVVKIEAGGNHTCAQLKTHKLRCWGWGGDGSLGYGNSRSVGDDETPASAGDVPVGGAIMQITAGTAHTCALLDTGNVRCWGLGDNGRLGYGNTNPIGDDETPDSAGDIPVGGAVAQIAAGNNHTCVLLTTGDIRCWGLGDDGRLGYGNINPIGDDETPATAGNVSIGETAVQITAGAKHSCALLKSGNIRCWGYGGSGRLGYGNRNSIGDDETPADISNIPVNGIVQIAAGGYHTCALLDTGGVHCWGRGLEGQLGYGNTENIGDNEAPANAGNVPLGGVAKQITAGHDYTCALLNTGNVRCWGYGAYGQLGYGNTNNTGEDQLPESAGNALVGDIVKQIGAGYAHTCALLVTGNVRCWGNGNSGRLGYGNTENVGDNEIPASAGNVPVGGTVVQITAGGAHTCALLDTGHVRCWGYGETGRLGYGNTNDIGDNETPASAGDVPIGGTVIQIAAGTYHTCALLDAGNIRCWGEGSDGALGYGNINNIGGYKPPASAGDVPIGGTAVQITAGSRHTCALLDTGNVRCWGYGFLGALGYGNIEDIGNKIIPAQAGDVSVGGTVIQITAGDGHTCALLDTGYIRCWGRSGHGQLGYGNTNNIGTSETPASAGNAPVF